MNKLFDEHYPTNSMNISTEKELQWPCVSYTAIPRPSLPPIPPYKALLDKKERWLLRWEQKSIHRRNTNEVASRCMYKLSPFPTNDQI